MRRQRALRIWLRRWNGLEENHLLNLRWRELALGGKEMMTAIQLSVCLHYVAFDYDHPYCLLKNNPPRDCQAARVRHNAR